MKTALEAPLGAGKNHFWHIALAARVMACCRRRVRRGGGFYIGEGLQLAIGRNSGVLNGTRRIYLDHAATTPVLPQARAAVAEGLELWANPSSPHSDGRAARAALEHARNRIKAALGWNHEVIFTSGASEAARLAFRRCHVQGPKPAISTVEHDAVRAQVPEGEGFNIAVGPTGLLDPAMLASWLQLAPGGLVAVQHVNNETGVIQPVNDIALATDAAGSHLLVDCAQSAGKLPLPNADLIMISGHKLGGPPGIGALLVRDMALLVPEGGQERGYRRGTENLPAILGLAAAFEANAWGLERLVRLRTILDQKLLSNGATIIGDAEAPVESAVRLATIAAYAMPGVSAMTQLVRFDSMGISVSAGSACSSGTNKVSHVHEAMGTDREIASRVIRVSFGSETGEDDVMTFADAWIDIAEGVKGRTP
jgi:cysteine desulfurase